jgi:hypothetical protein
MEIFVLSKDVLTVVAEGRANTYKRCHRENKLRSPPIGASWCRFPACVPINQG